MMLEIGIILSLLLFYNWDYYNPGTVNVNGDWDWNTITLRKGGDKHNKRIFKTTLPVHESVLDIRILDKTIKNQD